MGELTDRGYGDSGISPRGLAIFISILAVLMFGAESYRWLALHKAISLSSLYMPCVAINLWSGVPARGEAKGRLTMPWFIALTLLYGGLAAIALVVKAWFFLALMTFSLGVTIMRLYTERRQPPAPHAAR